MTSFTQFRAASAGLAFIATSLSSAPASADIVHGDDVIINNSIDDIFPGLCVGFDCSNGESFGADVIRLKMSSRHWRLWLPA